MKAIFALSTIASAVIAAKMSVVSLTADERAILEQELAEWKAEFGEAAREQGLLPQNNSILSEDERVDDELQRILDTKFAAEVAAAENPEATFSWRNKFALLSDEEFKEYVSVSFGRGPILRGGNTEVESLEEVEAAIAATKDWTNSGCVNAVQNQGSCGSCWAFSAVGVAESAHCIRTGKLLKLSEQQVTSCSTNGGSQGCNGGWPWYAIDYTASGVCLLKDYPYTSGSTGQTGSCRNSCTKQKLSIGKNVRVSGESSTVSAINKQPVSVTVEAGNSVWKNYRGGVVSRCPGAQSDHAVIAVGYDDGSIKIKNSWGSGWGESGYMRLKRGAGGQGTCNVVGGVSFPRI